MSVAGGAVPRFDVAVIGAGIMGCASAYRMAERGLRVAVLERESAPATGSTGRSAAGVRLQFSDETNIALSASSLREYRDLPAAAYRPIGYLFLVPPEHWAAHCAAVPLQRRLGAAVQMLSPAEAARIVPIDPNGLAGATWCAQDGVVDPHGICLHYAEQARTLGASLRMNAGVSAIERRPGGWRITAGEHSLLADRVVNAAGAWSGQVAALAGLSVPVDAARRVVFASAPLPASLMRAAPYPLTVDLGSGFYFRSENQRLIFGQSNAADTGFSEGIDWPWLDTVVASALDRFPWFEQVSLDRRACWWGYYEVTPDHNAIIGADPDEPAWINACGFSGHGVQQAAAVGRAVARIALDEPTEINLTSLSISRFRGSGGGTSPSERLIV
ncbi:MAG: FAD-dependent oxidoreductase [Burkholderiales bacterium]